MNVTQEQLQGMLIEALNNWSFDNEWSEWDSEVGAGDGLEVAQKAYDTIKGMIGADLSADEEMQSIYIGGPMDFDGLEDYILALVNSSK